MRLLPAGRIVRWTTAVASTVAVVCFCVFKFVAFRDGHSRMLRALAAIRDAELEHSDLYGPAVIERAEEELRKLPRSAFVEDRIAMQHRVAQLQLLQGETAASTRSFEAILATVQRLRGILPPDYEQNALRHAAIAHLRRGEVENCVGHCSCDSCILPLRNSGIHQKQDGSRQAIERLRQLLRLNRDDLTARWLLNVAAMTVDGHPHEVPEDLVIDSDVFVGQRRFPRFTNMASSMGVNTLSLSGGVVADDFDDDGWLDLVVSDWGPAGQLRYYQNLRNGAFAEKTEEAGLLGLFGGLNLVQADYDNDGDLDLLVLRGAWRGAEGRRPNSLLQNDGRGHFRDVTFEAGLGEAHFPTQTAAWADFDNDGDLDLYIGNESFASQLFRNDGTGRFVDVARQAGVANGAYTKGVVWGDYNNDDYPDLYVSNYGEPNRVADGDSAPDDLFASTHGAPNRLYHNNRDGTFTDIAAELGVTRPLLGFPAWFWDVNNDGFLDLFAASYDGDVADVVSQYLGQPQEAEPDCLYINDGQGGFEERSSEMGLNAVTLAMGANFGDLDNDGYPDFYLGTGAPAYESLVPNLCFWNQEGKRFSDVTIAGGFSHLQKGHGVAFADLDNDGDQDVVCVLGGAFGGDTAPNAAFVNPGFGNQWLHLKLKGARSNRSAIGAHVRVDVEDEHGVRAIYQRVSSGGSFGANPLRREIGLGPATRIVSLEVYWPASGIRQIFHDVPMGQFLEVSEGEDDYRVFPVAPANAERASIPR